MGIHTGDETTIDGTTIAGTTVARSTTVGNKSSADGSTVADVYDGSAVAHVEEVLLNCFFYFVLFFHIFYFF